MPPLLFPRHVYLGPGNDINDISPVDEDDAIAYRHDVAYENSVSAEDVLKADEQAIEEFWADYCSTGNWHSLIGAAGLKFKNLIENRVGVIYPFDMSGKRERFRKLSLRQDDDDQQSSKKKKIDHMQDPHQPSSSRDVSDIGQDEGYQTQLSQPTGNAPMGTDEVDSADAVGVTSKDTAGVTNPGESLGNFYILSSLSSPTFTFFRKSRLMHTWGFASKRFLLGPKTHESNYLGYNTSLAYVPVDWVPFYLSPAEFSLLPMGAYIKEVHVEIIPKGVRCSFDTGSTLTGSANSMHVIFGKHVVGLNHKVEHLNVVLKNDDKKPMEISSHEALSSTEFTNRLYGDKGQFSGTSDCTFPSSWGANRALPAYAMILTTGGTHEYMVHFGFILGASMGDFVNYNS